MQCGNDQEWTIQQFVIVKKKKQIDVRFSRVCPIIDNEFPHNIFNVACGSTRLSPCGFTTTCTLTKLCQK